MPEVKIENCPFCGKESEPILSLDWGQSYVYCPKCKLSGPNKISKKEATDSWNQVSRSVRESMWTKFDKDDKSTYPPKEEIGCIELAFNDGHIESDSWGNFGYGWSFFTSYFDDITYWRIPTHCNMDRQQDAHTMAQYEAEIERLEAVEDELREKISILQAQYDAVSGALDLSVDESIKLKKELLLKESK